jgi:hypothetical protein
MIGTLVKVVRDLRPNSVAASRVQAEIACWKKVNCRTNQPMLRNFLRRYFTWKFASWAVPILVGLWVGMVTLGLAFRQVQFLPFVLGYVFISATIPCDVGAWLTSKVLSERNPRNWNRGRRKNEDLKKATRNYEITKWIGVAALIGLILAGVWFTGWLKERKELSEMDGLLLPANDPSLEDKCVAISPTGIRFHFGNASIVLTGHKANVVKYRNRTVLGMEVTDNGELVVDADIRGEDNSQILSVSRDYFKVRTENIIESLSRRPDKSTLVLTDVHGNKLTIRYANKQTAIFSGTLYVTPVDYFNVTENGVVIEPANGRFGGPFCIGLAEGSTFVELTDPTRN